jgi:rod shape-determining protein MreD
MMQSIDKMTMLTLPFVTYLVGALVSYVVSDYICGFPIRLDLIVIYFWLLYAPNFVPAGALALFGVCVDVMVASPIGSHALFYLVMYWVVLSQRHQIIKGTFFNIWLCFVLLLVMYEFWMQLMVIVHTHTVLLNSAIVPSFIITALVFPFGVNGLFRCFAMVSRYG